MADRFDKYMDFEKSSFSRNTIDDYEEEDEEMGGDYGEYELNNFESDEKSEELACPFCSEDFDVLGLCCHIDADHRIEICPYCMIKVRMNMASHVITQHEDVLKISLQGILVLYTTLLCCDLNSTNALCIKKYWNTRSRSALFQFRKELQKKHLQSIKESSCVGSSSNAETDSKLLSFANSPRRASKHQTTKDASSTKSRVTLLDISKDVTIDRIQPIPSKDWHKERASRCNFLQGLVLSTILDDL
ncbi:protein DEHYDRATION-INDUCED 19 homolog 4-like isoform X1 [Salvia hispanica]|uniref:protein DEHYDRATION-INDUCED 19 homolog 4-like isoform X1 n=1 Tax=Salvia hispanica TaxID=49212 RepID=UPI002009551D|nr:protein DEHYDRATION-INDUCED 19 homolog 4-like isoform X1 [Salvia hispanica]